jgi:hypothetical protein
MKKDLLEEIKQETLTSNKNGWKLLGVLLIVAAFGSGLVETKPKQTEKSFNPDTYIPLSNMPDEYIQGLYSKNQNEYESALSEYKDNKIISLIFLATGAIIIFFASKKIK